MDRKPSVAKRSGSTSAFARPRANAIGRYFARPRDPLTSVVLVVPVFLVYHLGILFIDLRNGVDLVSGLTLQLLDYSVAAYTGFTLAVAATLFTIGLRLRKKDRVQTAHLAPLFLESLVWAVGMWILVGWATTKVVPGSILLPAGIPASASTTANLAPLEKIVLACGAGLHEEIVFRAGLCAGLAALLGRLDGLRGWCGAAVAVGLSSLVFAAVHYVGPLGETLALGSFVFRAIAGVYLALVFQLRGFAVAVYCHTVYDILVFFTA